METDVEQRADVRMRQSCDGARFPLEACQPILILSEGFGQHLDGDLPIQPGVPGLVDRPHAPFADLPEDAVFADPLRHRDGRAG